MTSASGRPPSIASSAVSAAASIALRFPALRLSQQQRAVGWRGQEIEPDRVAVRDLVPARDQQLAIQATRMTVRQTGQVLIQHLRLLDVIEHQQRVRPATQSPEHRPGLRAIVRPRQSVLLGAGDEPVHRLPWVGHAQPDDPAPDNRACEHHSIGRRAASCRSRRCLAAPSPKPGRRCRIADACSAPSAASRPISPADRATGT